MAKRKHSSDDSSSEEETKPKVKVETDSSSSSDDDGEWNSKAKIKSKKKKHKKGKDVKVRDEEREEGEVDDDEEDLEEDVEEFNDGFDENLMGDDADKERLAQMTEKEREQELFNRGEKREVLKTRFEIERKLRLAKKREQMKNKDNTDSSMRSTERRKNIEDKSKQKATLKVLKEQRDKKKEKQKQIKLRAADVYSDSSSDEEDTKKKKSPSSSDSNSDSSDSDTDKRKRDDDEDGRASADERDDYVITLEDVNAIRVSRFRVEKWCHAPFFGPTSVGCFARVGLGINKTTGDQVYRVTQITEVNEGARIYGVNPPTNSVKTNKVFKMRHGKDERVFRLEYLSNSPVTANEFSQWKERMEKEKIDLPTRGHVEQKKKDIANAMDFAFKDCDIEAMIKEKEKFNKTPKNYAMKKTQLMKMREDAEQNQDEEALKRINLELDQLEDRAKELDKQRTNSIAAISYINERNRLKNILDTEKAIMEEREANKKDGVNEEDDPFRRRTCRPTLVSIHRVNVVKPGEGTASDSDPNGPSNGLKAELGGSSALPNGSKLVSIPIKMEKRPASPTRSEKNDMFSAHDFDIQIDLLDIANNTTLNNSNSSSQSFGINSSSISTPAIKVPNRRSLNLEEYKKKKGLI
ncbi:RNA polymerase-associated protein RTF1 -like protein [Halotydeus destructor]|nr:RNA polymerase-associated protein RTF1 -like protein [Halotydeus destructor]